MDEPVAETTQGPGPAGAPLPPLAGGTDFELLDVTVLLADLRGFTALSAQYPPAVLIELLNRFLATMSDIVLQHHGTVDKFMGDAIMAVFGAPRAVHDHVLQAIACAAEMQLAMEEINAESGARGLPPVFAGIGINTGQVMAGWLGSPLHREYTVIGDAVNLASRIESFSLRGQVLMGESTFRRALEKIDVGVPTTVQLKGQPHPTTVYELAGIPDRGLAIARRDMRRSHRVRVHMPFSYQRVEGKLVSPELHDGVIHDIGYQGILADLHGRTRDYDEIRMTIDLSLIGYRAADIYGKVVRTVARDGAEYASIEFTSVTVQSDLSIRQFVQMLLQGCEESR